MAVSQKDLREIQRIGPQTRERILRPDERGPLRRHGVWLLGVSHAAPPFRFCRRRPGMLQILVTLRGEGRGWVDGAWRRLLPGQAYLTPAHALHAYHATRRWAVGWCMLDPAAFPDFRGDTDGGPVLREVNPAPWEHLLLGLCEAGAANGAEQELWAELLRLQCGRIIAASEPRRLWQLWARVRDELAAPWTLPLLAQSAGLGEETLRQQCHRELGESPMAHLARLRMRHAAALLETGQKVEYVARQVGYENAFAFSTAFKRIHGVPPSAVRRRTAALPQK